MKAILKTILLPLLLLAAVAGALVWLLPEKVTLFLVIIILTLILIVLGDIVEDHKRPEDHEAEG